MFDQRVTGLKLEQAGGFANAYDHISAKSFGRPKDRIDHRRYLQPWFARALWQNKIRFQRLRNIILHDFESTFCLRIGEGHAELVKASFWETFPGNFPFRVPEKNFLPSLVLVFVARHSITLAL